MNIEIINNIQKRMDLLELSFDKINKKLNALLIDNQSYIKRNNLIKPSIASKISYDGNGLVIKGEDLEEFDIPTLSIDKIKELRRELNKKINKSEINNFLSNKYRELQKSDIVGTGCKINYDKNGLVINTSDLLQEDIPDLSIDKIIGLSKELNYIKSLINNIEENNSKNEVDDNIIIQSNENKKLTENDIPISIINRLNKLEANFIKFASKQISSDKLIKLIENMKSENNDNNITPISKNESSKNMDNENILNRINSLELSMQKILNQFHKISELLKLNKRLELIEDRLNKLENNK